MKSYVWLLFKTCKIEFRLNKKSKLILEQKKQCFVTFWHSRIMLFPYYLAQFTKLSAVISSHKTAEALSIVVESYGHELIRGSSRKGALNAMRSILSAIHQGKSISLTPDGPKGPRFQIKGSITTLAKKFKLPIIPVTYSASKAVVLNSWDRFIIPLPWISKIIIAFDAPLILNDQDTDLCLENVMNKQVQTIDKELNLEIDY